MSTEPDFWREIDVLYRQRHPLLCGSTVCPLCKQSKALDRPSCGPCFRQFKDSREYQDLLDQAEQKLEDDYARL